MGAVRRGHPNQSDTLGEVGAAHTAGTASKAGAAGVAAVEGERDTAAGLATGAGPTPGAGLATGAGPTPGAGPDATAGPDTAGRPAAGTAPIASGERAATGEPDVGAVDFAALRAAATATAQRAYAPYSRFSVGAAGYTDEGRLVVGCNVENVAHGVGLCAECGLVSALHAGGGGRLVAVAVVDATGGPCSPCGRCRQLLLEAGGPQCLLDQGPGTPPVTIGQLLPGAFVSYEPQQAAAVPTSRATAADTGLDRGPTGVDAATSESPCSSATARHRSSHTLGAA